MPGNKANSNGKWTQTRKVLGFSDCGFTSHGFSRRRKNAPMNKIAAAVPWEHGENLLSALRKHVQVCLRQYIWSGSGGGVGLALVSCVPGELPSKSQFITFSRGATTMQVNYGEKAIGSLLLHCYIYYLSSDHSLFVSFEEIPLARENLQQILL